MSKPGDTLWVNVGCRNMVVAATVVALLSSESASMRRLKDEAGERNKLITPTHAWRMRPIIITASDHVILSAVQVVKHTQRFYAGEDA